MGERERARRARVGVLSINPDIVATAEISRDGLIFLSSGDLAVAHANSAAQNLLSDISVGLKSGTAIKQLLALLAREADFGDLKSSEAVRQALGSINAKGEADLPVFGIGTSRISWRKAAGPAGMSVLVLRDIGKTETLVRTLADHKTFIQHLIDVLPIPVYVKNVDGVINRCNTAFANLLGKETADVIGQKSGDVCPASLETVLSAHEKPLLATEEGHVREEIEFTTHDDAMCMAIFAASTLKAPSGSIAGTIGSLIDVTSLKKAEAEVAVAADRLTDILQKAPVGVGISDREEGRFLFHNKRFSQLLSLADEKDATDSILLSERYREKSLREMETLGELHDVELRIRRPGEQEARWLRTSLEPLAFAGSEAILWWVDDITKHKRAERELQSKANNDALTGLANRARFMQRLNQCETVLRGTETPAAVFLLDLDGFKDVNDSMGHAAGDWVLTETARRLTRVARRADEISRLGGDEFTILFVNKGREAEMTKMADEIVRAVAEPYLWEGKDCGISASVGFAVFDGGFCDMSEQLRRADSAMYEAKTAGKGCFRIYHAAADQDED